MYSDRRSRAGTAGGTRQADPRPAAKALADQHRGGDRHGRRERRRGEEEQVEQAREGEHTDRDRPLSPALGGQHGAEYTGDEDVGVPEAGRVQTQHLELRGSGGGHGRVDDGVGRDERMTED
jgi:hypothetical protein